MAIFHLSLKIISRGKGKSAVAAAAYRAGEKIINDYDGVCHDYTKKRGIVQTEILLPDHAPKEYADRSTLWNAVEKVEGNRNSQLAREIEISLPAELSMEQNIALAREYVQHSFVDAGMVADLCIHDLGTGNPHAHIMLILRPIEQDGSWGAKSKKEYILDENGERIRLPSGEYKSRKIYTVDWNEQSKADIWREQWAKIGNEYLVKNGFEPTLDHRSYERQGLDILPTVHMGVAASQMEKKGIVTDRGNHNRKVSDINSELRQTQARINKQKNWLYSLPLVDAPSTTDTFSAIADSRNLDNRWQTIKNLKTSSKVFLFLQNNGIDDYSQLAHTVEILHGEFQELSADIKSKERRLETLDTHLSQWNILNKHKAVNKKYNELPQKKQDDFYDKHQDEIQLYRDAKSYFDRLMANQWKDGDKKTLPIKKWQKEQRALLAERYGLMEKYYRLKEDVRSVEVLQRGAEKLIKEAASEIAVPVKRHELAI